MGRSAPCSSSGIGAFAGFGDDVSDPCGWRGLGRWLSVLDCGFGLEELFAECAGEDGLSMVMRKTDDLVGSMGGERSSRLWGRE